MRSCLLSYLSYYQIFIYMLNGWWTNIELLFLFWLSWWWWALCFTFLLFLWLFVNLLFILFFLILHSVIIDLIFLFLIHEFIPLNSLIQKPIPKLLNHQLPLSSLPLTLIYIFLLPTHYIQSQNTAIIFSNSPDPFPQQPAPLHHQNTVSG